MATKLSKVSEIDENGSPKVENVMSPKDMTDPVVNVPYFSGFMILVLTIVLYSPNMLFLKF